MNKLTEMKNQIYEMKQALYILMEEKGNLSDIEVINASQKLDIVLNQYYHLSEKEN